MLDEQDDEDIEVVDDSVDNCFSVATFIFFACKQSQYQVVLTSSAKLLSC